MARRMGDGHRVLALCLILIAARACGDGPGGPSTTGRVANGAWGGDNIGLTVTDDGGTVEYACARGTIAEPMTLDGDGRFSVRGTHVREHGGPQREGDPPPERPARYTGRADGKTMSLTVTLTDTTPPEEVGTFNLTLGRNPHLTKCL